ncbi:hypothetical protein AUTU_06970 [Aureibacter tunicatorum]|nr:hypothetical protein AUTU_06970 [Aureibacter tunicatorum]
MTFSGCALNKMAKMAKEQEVTVDPNPLEVHADAVEFDMSAVLPTKMMRKGFEYEISPAYKYDGKKIDLNKVTLEGDQYADSDKAPRVNENFEFPYNSEITNGDLVVSGTVRNVKSGKEKEAVKDFAVAKGLITTSTLVENVYSPSYAFHGYNNQEELVPTYVEFFFQQGSPVLSLYAASNKEEGKAFKAFVAEKNVTRTVIITGTHSPEGPERVNSNLSENRAKAVEKEYRKLMKRYDYKGAADSIKFVLKPVVDNWGQFKEELKSFDKINESQKQEVLRIINGPGSFEEQQDKLAKLKYYKTLFNGMYPSLRNAKTEILTVLEKKSDPEIAALAKQIIDGKVQADTLNDNEMLWAASMTPSLSEKQAIYEVLIRQTNAWQAHNNLGAIYIAQAADAKGSERSSLLQKANTEFELANKLHENGESYANMGVIAYMQGNTQQAYELVNKAFAKGLNKDAKSDLQGVKGALEIRLGKYPQAITTLSSATPTADNLFNKGLAQLLNKEYQNANVTFADAIDKDSKLAIAYYAAAVSNARLDRTSDVAANLKKAVAIDPSLKSKALTDLEFSKISTSESFRNAVK